MDVKVCRACLGLTQNMTNIFETKHESGILIADVITKCTGVSIKKQPEYPEVICSCCLKEANNAFEIIETYERSYEVLCKRVQEMEPTQIQKDQ